MPDATSVVAVELLPHSIRRAGTLVAAEKVVDLDAEDHRQLAFPHDRLGLIGRGDDTEPAATWAAAPLVNRPLHGVGFIDLRSTFVMSRQFGGIRPFKKSFCEIANC